MDNRIMTMRHRHRRMFGLVCRALRDAKGLTITQLADMMNVSTATISNVEKGRCGFSPKNLVRFCNAMDVSMGDMTALLQGRTICDAIKIRLFDKIINLNEEE